MRGGLSVLVLNVFVTLSLHAQAPAGGSISGVARDEQGAVVPEVAVKATSAAVSVVYQATTDRTGTYRLVDLPPGEYTLTAELNGFATIVRPSIRIRVGVNIDVNLEMKVGAIGETVEVRIESPLLETRSGTQAVNVSGELLRQVPLSERREWYGALALAPGVVTTEFAGSRQFGVHGATLELLC